MARDRRIEVIDKLVWTKKSTSTSIAHPITEAMSAAELASIRSTELTVHDGSANLTVAIGYQLADEDDELQWGSATVLSAAWAVVPGSPPQTTYEATFTDVALTKRKVRLVILAKNTTGAAVEVGRIGAKIDLREHELGRRGVR